MPREQLLGLAADADRLLAAGAGAGLGNEGLARRARTLRELGRKVPALLPVADAVDKLTGAAPKQAGPAFLELLVTARQLRASLSSCGQSGELEPIADSGPWRTPLSMRDLRPLVEALTTSGGGREATLRDAASHGVLGDMRLAAVLLDALGDSYAAVADLVADEVLPSLGKAMLPELLSRFEPNGKAPDARRLRAVCKIDRAAGADLCRRVLGPAKPRGGPSVPVRAQALQALPDLVPPEEAEQAGLRFRDDRSVEVRAAALSALRTSSSDVALYTLMAGLFDADHLLNHMALNALAELPNPGATPRLIRELEKVAAPFLPGPRDDGARALDRDAALNKSACLATALGKRKQGSRAAAARALIPLAACGDETLRRRVFQALTDLGPVTEEVAPALAAALRRARPSDRWPMMDRLTPFLEAYPDRLAPPVLAELKETPWSMWFGPAPCLEKLLPLADRYPAEVLEVLREGAKTHNEPHAVKLIEVALQLGPAARGLLPELARLLRAGFATMPPALIPLFARLDDDGETALPLLIAGLKDHTDAARLYALKALACYGPRARAAADTIKWLLPIEPVEANREAAKETLRAIGAG
jgi:HEAT repeat protein